MIYKCISADSHLEVRPDRYVKRVPARYRDRAPKVITLEDGTLAVLQEGRPPERLIGVGVIPITNIDDAVAELNHCAKVGLKAVAIDNFPARNRIPWAEEAPLPLAQMVRDTPEGHLEVPLHPAAEKFWRGHGYL